MALRFSEDGPPFPEQLVDALVTGEAVFLCGAGVSAPQLPGFGQLVDNCFDQLHVAKSAAELNSFKDGRFEEVLGSLSRRLVNPDDMIANVVGQLQFNDRHRLERHHTILRLSRDLENRPTLVTTNFDTFFEHALSSVGNAASIRGLSIAGQDLPPPGSTGFGGIIHIHGRIADDAFALEQTPLVVTSADYGDAYMRSGWASRFLFDLSRCKTIVLVGYSAGDAPVRYFLNVLAADRARFQDLRPVYALDGLRGPDEQDTRWEALAVQPIFYRYGDGDRRYDALWRDLDALAELVERPRQTRKAWAEMLLARAMKETSDSDRDRVAWLFTGRTDLWSTAIASIEDADWFNFFAERQLWGEQQAPWILSAWVARDLQSSHRFQRALAWRGRFGRAFGEEIARRLRMEKDLPDLWCRAWRLLSISSPDREATWAERTYHHTQMLAGPVVFDSDLRKAVDLLAPVLVLEPSHAELYGEVVPDPPERLFDLTRPDLTVFDRGGLSELVDALAERKETLALLEIASARLRDTVGLALDCGGIQGDYDVSNFAVPSIEPHEQNLHHDGAVFLTTLIARLLAKALPADREPVRALAAAWRGLPGALGLRLWLHALRMPLLFDADAVAAALLELPITPFWHIRRELALVLRDRAGEGDETLVAQLEQRILAEGEAYYARYTIEPGQPDWRSHARDAVVWLRLKMLAAAGRLSAAGAAELQAIVSRHDYLDRDVVDQDFFGSYVGPARSIEGDPQPILDASAEDRLEIAHQVIRSSGIEQQYGWGSYCRVDPQGAYDTLVNAQLDAANAPLWRDLISALAFADEDKRAAQATLVPRVFATLAAADQDFLARIVQSLADLYWRTERSKLDASVAWWGKLFTAAVASDDRDVDDVRDVYGDAINSPAGRLTEALLRDIDKLRSAGAPIDRCYIGALRAAADADARQGMLARAVLVQSAGFVITIGDAEVVARLDRALDGEGGEARALRAVLVGATRTTLVTTKTFGRHILRAVTEPNNRDAAFVASKIVAPALSIERREHDADAWGITQLQCEQALRVGPPELRSGAAKLLVQWIHTTEGGGAANWTEGIGPMLGNIWPRERVFRSDDVSRHFAELAVGAKDAFPEALHQLLPYLLPMQGHGGTHFLSAADVADQFPRETLVLLWRLFGPGSSSNLYGVPAILERLIAAMPEIEVDRRLQWLDAHATRYD